MNRRHREKSEIGVYHVLMQGAGDRDLFLDEEDYHVFVEYLIRLMTEAWVENDEPGRPYFRTYAYCLTPKEFRLVLKEEKYELSAAMQSISQLYSRYFSSKYCSYGAIYRSRFCSEPVNDDERMDVVLRYLHQTPLRQEVTGNLDDYPYSSWHEYVGGHCELPRACEIPKVYGGLTAEERRERLLTALPPGTACLEPQAYRVPKPTETQILSMIRVLTPATTWDEFKAIPKDEKLKTIKQLLQNGASIRQMEKLTGIGRGIIQNL